MNPETCPAGFLPYVIRKGDTLINIAKVYGSDVNNIILANPTIQPTNLIIGQVICIPLQPQLYPNCPTTNYYVVKKEDTFESIASYFNVTPLQLLYTNYGIDPNDLYEDQILCIPVAPSPVQLLINREDSRLFVFKEGTVFKIYPILYCDPNKKGEFIVLNKQIDSVMYGSRFLGLSEVNLGIHGINQELSSTRNSIALSNEDILELFNLVSVGTPVVII